MIYTEFRTWKKVSEYRLKQFFEGIYGVIYCSLILGALSACFAVIRKINAFYRREMVAGCIIAAIILLMSAGWLNTFVRERRNYIEAQHKADSLAYNLTKVTEMYEARESVFLFRDTLSNCK